MVICAVAANITVNTDTVSRIIAGFVIMVCLVSLSVPRVSS